MPRNSTAFFRVSVPSRRVTLSADATSVPMCALRSSCRVDGSTRRSRALPPAENVSNDDLAQINHDFSQPFALIEHFIHSRGTRRRPVSCHEAAFLRDEPRFWTLVCHGPLSSRQPERSSPLRLVLALQCSADIVRESVHPTAKFWRRILPKICLLRDLCSSCRSADETGHILWRMGESTSNEEMHHGGQAFDKMLVAQWRFQSAGRLKHQSATGPMAPSMPLRRWRRRFHMRYGLVAAAGQFPQGFPPPRPSRCAQAINHAL